jgi:protein-disulfide isomerase
MTVPSSPRSRMPLALGVVVALILALGTLWVSARPSASPGAGATPNATAKAPQGTTSSAPPAASTLSPSNPASVVLYLDPQCPICAQFEKTFGGQIDALAASGKITIGYHVMSFLDRNLNNDSSTRGANAMFCARDAGKMGPYVRAVLLGQPEKEGDGFTDARLVEFGAQAGISGDALTTFTQCVMSKAHLDTVKESETSAEQAGVQGTPSLAVDGKLIDMQQLTATNLEVLIAGAHQ